MKIDDNLEGPPEPVVATWEYKKTFAINDNISVVVKETIKATEAQIEQYRRKIAKLTYGS
jgi:hypothetical protein